MQELKLAEASGLGCHYGALLCMLAFNAAIAKRLVPPAYHVVALAVPWPASQL